jgi:hypothetical protein
MQCAGWWRRSKMHESGLVRDLMGKVESELEGTTARVNRVRLRVGAMSGIDPASLREGARHYALEDWGYVPEIEVETSTDPTDVNALGVLLVAIGVDG